MDGGKQWDKTKLSGDENQSSGIWGPGSVEGFEDLWEELELCFLVEFLGNVVVWRSFGVDGQGTPTHMEHFVRETKEKEVQSSMQVMNQQGSMGSEGGVQTFLCGVDANMTSSQDS